MKTLGLLGGMTYHATGLYYNFINNYVQSQLGGGHSAKILLHSFDYAEITSLWRQGKHDAALGLLVDAANNMKRSGADATVLCVNTAHQYASRIEQATKLPLLHIIDFSAEAIQARGFHTVGLLGTKATMEGDFIKGRLEQKYGLKVLLPPEATHTPMDDVIHGDLARNVVTKETKDLYKGAAADMVERGAQGVILACTELQFVLKPEDVEVTLFDTVELHANGVAKWALESP